MEHAIGVEHNLAEDIERCRIERSAQPVRSSNARVGISSPLDHSLRALRAWVSRFETFSATLPICEAACYHFLWALSHEGVALVASAIKNGVSEGIIRAEIAPVVAIQRQSPFARRLQDWPRGYPGDFETIEYLCRQCNGATPGTIGWYIEAMALNTPVAPAAPQ